MADHNSIYCPGCRTKTNLIIRAAYNASQCRYQIAECNGCNLHFLVQRLGNSILKISPSSLPRPVDERIVENVKENLKSALVCFSVNEYRASATMARRALQVICLDKGAPKSKKLNEQIDWLFTQGIITKDLQDWAHEVRYVGNDGAHPDDPGDSVPVTENESEDILALLEKIADVLYVATAIASDRKRARQGEKIK